MTIDLIDPDRYTAEDEGELDPADERLLEEDSLAPQDFKRCVESGEGASERGASAGAGQEGVWRMLGSAIV